MLLRINVWSSCNGFKDSSFKDRPFPYVALSPSSRKKSEFRNISDVHNELINLSDEAEKKGFKVGEAIYSQSFYFADHKLLVSSDQQDQIKAYRFCKTFSCPPHQSLQDTPIKIIDDFLIIDEECNNFLNKKKEDSNA